MMDNPVSALLKLGSELAKKVRPEAAGVVLALVLGIVGAVLLEKYTLLGGLIIALAALAIVALAIMWLRTGAKPPPPGPAAAPAGGYSKKNVCIVLEGMRSDVAKAVGVPLERVRANVFAPAGSVLRIVPGLVSNMDGPELELEIAPGTGSTGRCYASRAPTVAVYDEGWQEFVLDAIEMAKLNPSLRWILSVPVQASGGDLWILNCDGLEDSPPRGRLEQGLSYVLLWRGVLSDVLANKSGG